MSRLLACVFLLLMVAGPMPAEALGAPSSLPLAGKTALIMVDDPGCGWCRTWDREVGVGYPRSEEGQVAPLLRMQKGDARLRRYLGLGFTPTFILVVNGEERGRIVGYSGADFFWADISRMVKHGGAVPEIHTHAFPVQRL